MNATGVANILTSGARQQKRDALDAIDFTLSVTKSGTFWPLTYQAKNRKEQSVSHLNKMGKVSDLPSFSLKGNGLKIYVEQSGLLIDR